MADALEPIYESPRSQASERRMRRGRRERILLSALAATTAWFLLDMLGVPHIFGISGEAGIIPFAAAGAVLGVTRFRWLPVIGALGLIVLSLIVAYTPVIAGPARAFIRSDPQPSTADAVVALSAGVTGDGFLSQQGMDRLLAAVALVKRGVAPVLVVTREEKNVGRLKSNSSGDQQRVTALVGIEQVVSTRAVKSTHDEALAVARLARQRGWHHIALVTSPFHSRRACRTFEKAGMTVSCIPSESRDIAIHHLSFPHDRMQAFAMWLYETAGTIRYRQLGWL